MSGTSKEGNGAIIDLSDVKRASEVIRPHVVRTPVVPCELLSRRLGCSIQFKAENLQHNGAFKARGATNAVLSLNEEDASRGVVTHSSGNHAAALARAAAIRDIPAFVVMPENSSPKKIAAVRGFGVEPVFCDPSTESRELTAGKLQQETGATLVHPYDSPDVMAGQGTVGLEILEQADSIDAILVPVGGGGLLSGVLTAVKSLRPEIDVIAIEPECANDAARSLLLGTRQMPTRYDTIADGLRTALGVNTFPIIRDLLDEIIQVTEDQIRAATRSLSEDAHLVAEPSGAVTLAAVQQYADRFAGRSIVAVVSGGNLSFGDCQLGRVPTS
jgi:threonine dehydratase